MAELSKLQQAVAYQALYGALGPVVKAGGDGLRGEVDRELRSIYEQTGAKTYKVVADGVVLGTYSVVESRAEPEEVMTRLAVTDNHAFVDWTEGGEVMEDMARYLDETGQWEGFAEWYLTTYGVIPDGVEVRHEVVPAKPARYKGGQIRVDKAFQAEVRRRMEAGLAALVAPAEALLGEGE